MNRFVLLFLLTFMVGIPTIGCDDGGGGRSDSDSDSDSDADYPPGPYGWNAGMVWGTDTGAWDLAVADVIANICLNNANGDEVCLGDYYRSADFDLIWVDFSAFG